MAAILIDHIILKQNVKEEILEQLELDIKFGFDNDQQLFHSIREMFYNEDDFDEDWLRQIISEKYIEHQKESLTWIRPNDFDKIAKIFDELTKEKIVCLHKAGFTRQDGEGDCMEIIEELNKLGIKAIGYCYYHSQDLARTVNPSVRNLLLGFDSPTLNDKKALQIAKKIVGKFRKNGFQVDWTGSVNQRIEVNNITWQKSPDSEEWGPERVINILVKLKNNKKPLWKFW